MTQNKYFFSIITITYNNLDGLIETHRSVLRQQDSDYEWIVIDGGSTDNTKDYLDGLGQPNITWVSEKDKGIYDAMNKGAARANGQYLLFLNAGDTLVNSSTLKLIKDSVFSRATRPEFIYGDSLEGEVVEDFDISEDKKSKYHKNDFFYKRARSHTKAGYGMFTHHQSMLYKLDAVSDLKFDMHYQISADYKYTMEALARIDENKILYINEPICIYKPGGISQHQVKRGRREQFEIRSSGKIVGPVTNILTYFIQMIAMMIRRKTPFLYRRLKDKPHKA